MKKFIQISCIVCLVILKFSAVKGQSVDHIIIKEKNNQYTFSTADHSDLAEINIYNSWGELMYHSHDKTQSFNFNSKEFPKENYIYVIKTCYNQKYQYLTGEIKKVEE